MSAPVDLSGAEWDRAVAGDPPLLVDFWAPGCVPCRAVETVVREAADRHAGQLRVARLNVDEHPGVAARYDVLSLPTLILFSGGQPVERLTGAVKTKRLEKALHDHVT